MGEIIQRPTPPTALPWTGERLTTETTGQVEIEHLHRYFFARSLCRNLDVLDVASGEGYGSALLAQVAKSVVGVDIAEESVEHAKAAHGMPGLIFLHGDARRIPCSDSSFDAVVSFETLEQFYQHAEFLAEIRRVLRPGGLFIVSSPERDVYSPAGGTPNPYHVRELTHTEFDALMRQNFQHVALYGQRPLLGSALMAEEPPASTTPLLTFERRDGRLFEASTGLPRPIYLVAVASDAAFSPCIGSLYIETSGIEAIFATAAASRQENQSLTERLIKEREYAQRVQAELNRRDVQLADQVTEAQAWHRQLVELNLEHEALGRQVVVLEEHVARANGQIAMLTEQLAGQDERLAASDAGRAALVAAHGRLLEQRAARHARQESALRAELKRLTLSTSLDRTQSGGTVARQTEIDVLQTRLAAAEAELRAVLASSSWRLTGPLRGMAERHPATVAKLHGFLGRHPRMRSLAARSVRGAWRALTLRPIRPRARQLAAPVSMEPFGLPAPAEARFVFRKQAVSPVTPAPAPALPRGYSRRALCVGHVLPFPPCAGNEYRIHRLLNWLAEDDWDLLVVICPLPHEMPSEQQIASAAAIYPNLIVCDHAGTLLHNLSADCRLLDGLRPATTADFAALLHEDDGGDSARARILNLLRTFCPDPFVELLLQLQDLYQPTLLLAEYVFMTRPFALLNPGITTAIDTIDVFSTKAGKVEQYGVSDGLAMTEAEESALLRRANILIAIQPEEARDLARLAPDRKVVSIGVDFPVVEVDRTSRPGASVLVVASASPMNVKGLHDFLSFSWPLVRKEVPVAELLIVGAVGDTVDQPADNVRVLGRIEDLRPLYAQARVTINPAIAETGLKIKTVEALCHLRPVVCWPSGSDGVAAEARRFCQVATDWVGFARHVIRLLQSDEEAFAVEDEREILHHVFSPEVVYAPLSEVLHDARVASRGPSQERHDAAPGL
jgi:SAM-dependent methyltransferase